MQTRGKWYFCGQTIPLMLKDIYKKTLIVIVVLIASLSSIAQQYHFIYIQADNQQPFYVKYGSKNYSSSSIGYLILPKLIDGTLTVQIGFPKNLYPEQTFTLSVTGKDYGYALKNFDAKGWGLFNFQTTDIVMNAAAGAASDQVTKPTVTTNTSNPFGNMLADAINDSTLNQKRITTDTVSKQTMPPVSVLKDTSTVTTAPNIHSDSMPKMANTVAEIKTPVIDSAAKNNAVSSDTVAKNNTSIDSTRSIIKSSEKTTGTGTDLVFLDNSSKDTIHAFIPVGDSVKNGVTDTAKNKIDNPFFNSNNTNATTVSQPHLLDTATNNGSTVTSNIITNSNCQKMLSSYDANKLKKKITSLHNEEDMIAAVKKAMRGKCLTTEQVKDLSGLFLSDENRYNFFDAVYPNVSDYFNYPQLQNTLIDTYYKNRFKALLR